MKDTEENMLGRRALLTGLSMAAVAGLAAGARPASAQTGSAGSQAAPHPKDAWLAELPGTQRVFVDSSTMVGGPTALWNAGNIIESHISEYDGQASDYALVVCFRHLSTSYGYDDVIWAKYGSILMRNADPVPVTNPMKVAAGNNGQHSIPDVVEMGVQFAVCGRATRRMAGAIANATGSTPDAVFAELQAGLIPNAHLVPAGVIAATRAQALGYSLLYAE
ncbi:MAG: hypothetical protein Q7V56_10465 [Gammaproteobacteria bacterium]|nr:hypothetical protein [Gammaproteobacteria bacterium]